MKRILLITVIALIGFSASARRKPIEERPQDIITYTYDVTSNHSVSSTILGLEYSYEAKLADRWTLISRAGLVPTGFEMSSGPYFCTFEGTLGLGVSLEARWYSNIAKRAEYGRCTYNNSSDFISMRIRANTNGDLEISFTPAYGIRRSFGRLWFHEATFGPKIGVCGDDMFIAPHIQYRIGIAF